MVFVLCPVVWGPLTGIGLAQGTASPFFFVTITFNPHDLLLGGRNCLHLLVPFLGF